MSPDTGRLHGDIRFGGGLFGSWSGLELRNLYVGSHVFLTTSRYRLIIYKVGYIAFRDWLYARRLTIHMRNILQHLLSGNKLVSSPRDIETGLSFPEETLSRAVIPLAGAKLWSQGHTDERLVSDRKRAWTRVHSHFTLMGGYVFGSKHSDPHSILGDGGRATLTPAALRKLADSAPELIPNIEKSDINDKSKANGFAKTLVCAQACWFIVQVVSRLAIGLPISLLEMNTLLHALCCLLIYLAWWHKPLDIDEPFLIDITDAYVTKVCAWMMVWDMQNLLAYSRTADDTSSQLEPHGRHELSLLYKCDFAGEKDDNTRERIATAKEFNRQAKRSETASTFDARGNLTVYEGQSLFGFVLVDTLASSYKIGRSVHTKITVAERARLRLAHSLRTQNDSDNIWKLGLPWLRRYDGKMLEYGTPVYRSPDDMVQSLRSPMRWSPRTVLWAGMLIAGSAYGGVHLIAWNGPFPSHIQRILWRASCFIIISPVGILGALLLVFCLFWVLIIGYNIALSLMIKIMPACEAWEASLKRYLHRVSQNLPDVDFTGFFVKMPLELLIYGPGLIYAAARTYLIVECFINIAYLSEDVYREPSWSKYLPHFAAG